MKHVWQRYTIDRIGEKSGGIFNFNESQYSAQFVPMDLNVALLIILDTVNLADGMMKWKTITGKGVTIPSFIEYTLTGYLRANNREVAVSQKYRHNFNGFPARIKDASKIGSIPVIVADNLFGIYPLNDLLPTKIFEEVQALQFEDT